MAIYIKFNVVWKVKPKYLDAPCNVLMIFVHAHFACSTDCSIFNDAGLERRILQIKKLRLTWYTTYVKSLTRTIAELVNAHGHDQTYSIQSLWSSTRWHALAINNASFQLLAYIRIANVINLRCQIVGFVLQNLWMEIGLPYQKLILYFCPEHLHMKFQMKL